MVLAGGRVWVCPILLEGTVWLTNSRAVTGAIFSCVPHDSRHSPTAACQLLIMFRAMNDGL